MRSMFIASLLMSSVVAFAAADKGGSPKPVAAPPTTPAPAPVNVGDTPVVPPVTAPVTGDATTPAPAADTFEVFGITSDIPVPANRPKPGRGGQSVYPFEKLEINQSFGIKGKSSKLIASTVSSANKRNMEDVMQAATNADGTPKLNADGTRVTEPVMVSQTTKNKDGTTSTAMVKKQRPTKLFVAYPVDPKTDKQGASVRVFRVALPA